MQINLYFWILGYENTIYPNRVDLGLGRLDKPYVIICLNVIAAESTQEAEQLATTQQQFFLNVVRGSQQLLQPPVLIWIKSGHPVNA